MIEFLLEAANRPFAVSLGLMIGIGLLEGLGQVIGFGFSNLLDNLFPDLDADVDLDLDMDADLDFDADFDVDADVDMDADFDADLDADADLDGGTDLVAAGHNGSDLDQVGSSHALSGLLSWFHLGRVPLLILIVLFLFSFSASGYIIQFFLKKHTGAYLPGSLAALAALLLGLGFVRGSGGLFSKMIPKEETEAVSKKSFIGREAVIVLGTARTGHAAQAKIIDQFGKTHYLMVEPAKAEEVFKASDRVLLVERKGPVFLGVPNPAGPEPRAPAQIENDS